MRFLRTALTALLSAFCAHAGYGVVAQGRLNHTLVQKAYLEADWGRLSPALRSFLANPGPKADRMDSLCALEYLAVMEASRPETRDQGEDHFRRLLELEPSFPLASLHDLFVSDETLSRFRGIRSEYLLSREDAARKPAPAAAPVPSADPERAGEESRGKKWIWIGAGGVALASALTAVWVLSTESHNKNTNTVPIQL